MLCSSSHRPGVCTLYAETAEIHDAVAGLGEQTVLEQSVKLNLARSSAKTLQGRLESPPTEREVLSIGVSDGAVYVSSMFRRPIRIPVRGQSSLLTTSSAA